MISIEFKSNMLIRIYSERSDYIYIALIDQTLFKYLKFYNEWIERIYQI